jgi:hypothetical protein
VDNLLNRYLTTEEKEVIRLLDACIAAYNELPVIEGFGGTEFVDDLVRWKRTIEYRCELVDHLLAPGKD